MPNPFSYLAADAVERDLLRSSGAFDPAHYVAQCGLPAGTDPLAHYLDLGWRWGLEPRPGFEAAFLQRFYETAGLYGPPLLIWLELSARYGWLPTTRLEAEARADIMRASSVYDPVGYARRLPPDVDPALHYVVVGEAAGWRPSEEFDPDFYAERYPDVSASGHSPLLHYASFGQRENRLPRAKAETMAFQAIQVRPGRRVVVMLVHEATRTGAPLLGLNIATHLAESHDVVSVIMRTGSIEPAFAQVSAALIGPMRWEEWNPAEMSRVAERLVEAYDPLYAVANSIETSQLVPHLAKRGVPCVALLHEFASYTKPRQKLNDAFDWASDIVFPARIVARSSFKECPHLLRRRGVHVFPQGKVELPTDGEHSTDTEFIRKGFVVLGAGTVDIRKAVDVFLAVAAACRRQAPELDIQFVWVGGGFDPKINDYAIYLTEQIDRSGLSDCLTMLEPVADLDPLYEAADVFLLSSRLDPQPNVGIDALSRGLPVVCFDGASGTAEVLIDGGKTGELVVPYLDTAAAATVIVGLARDGERHNMMRRAVAALASRVFDLPSYTRRVDELGVQAAARLRPQDMETLHAADLDEAMIVPPSETVPFGSGLAHVVQQQWAVVGMSEDQAGNLWFLRGHAGFHPQVYASLHSACTEGGEVPLAHWLRAGKPAGPWSREVLSPLEAPSASAIRVALHGHFHYPDLLADLLARRRANGTPSDLWLTTDTEAKAARMRALCRAADGMVSVAVVPNRGRDIGPFLHLLPAITEAGYDVVGHVHGKRSASTDVDMGERWRNFLWDNLVGPAPMLDTAAKGFASDPGLGLIIAEDPHLVGWDANRPMAEELAARMGLANPLETFFDFPLGTMFWARPAALAPLLSLGLGWDDYPEEPLAYDGTILHAIERLLPFVVRDAGFRVGGIRMPHTSW